MSQHCAERSQIVELLRCAADIVHEKLNRGPVAKASDFLGHTLSPIEGSAYRAVAILGGATAPPEAYRERLLEAAARIEEQP